MYAECIVVECFSCVYAECISVCMQNALLLSVCRMHYCCFSCMYAKCIVVYYPTTSEANLS